MTSSPPTRLRFRFLAGFMLALCVGLVALQAAAAPGIVEVSEAGRLRDRLASVAGEPPMALTLLAGALADREAHASIVDPAGAVLATAGRSTPPDGIGVLSDPERNAVLAGTTIDIVRDGWLTVAGPIAGESLPGGIAVVSLPLDHARAGIGGVARLLPVAVLLLVFLLGIAWLLLRRSAGPVASPPPTVPAAPAWDTVARPLPAPGDPRLGELARDRDGLVRGIIEVREQLGSVTLGEMLDRALAAAGVTQVTGDGERFDERRHRAVGTAPTADPRLHDHVALTERPGYADRGRLIRPPEVLVYQHTETGR